MAGAIEQLAKIQIEVRWKALMPYTRPTALDAQVAPVFLGPHLKTNTWLLRRRGPGPAGPQIFMGHGAQGVTPSFMALAALLVPQLPLACGEPGRRFVPRRATSTRSTSSCRHRKSGSGCRGVGNLQIAQAIGLAGRQSLIQPAATFGEVGHLCVLRKYTSLMMASTGISEQDGVQPGPTDDDLSISPEGWG